MFDPAVHAALIVVAAWLLQLIFTALNLQIGNDLIQSIAIWVVGYILSLFGYSVYLNLKARSFGVNRTDEGRYHPWLM